MRITLGLLCVYKRNHRKNTEFCTDVEYSLQVGRQIHTNTSSLHTYMYIQTL